MHGIADIGEQNALCIGGEREVARVAVEWVSDGCIKHDLDFFLAGEDAVLQCAVVVLEGEHDRICAMSIDSHDGDDLARNHPGEPSIAGNLFETHERYVTRSAPSVSTPQ